MIKPTHKNGAVAVSGTSLHVTATYATLFTRRDAVSSGTRFACHRFYSTAIQRAARRCLSSSRLQRLPLALASLAGQRRLCITAHITAFALLTCATVAASGTLAAALPSAVSA